MDVWRFGADGSIDVRMSGGTLLACRDAFPSAGLRLTTWSGLWREAELRDALQSRVNASWDEEYVSSGGTGGVLRRARV